MLQEAFRHLKAVGAWGDGVEVLATAGIDPDAPGVLTGKKASAKLASRADRRAGPAPRVGPHPAGGRVDGAAVVLSPRTVSGRAAAGVLAGRGRRGRVRAGGRWRRGVLARHRRRRVLPLPRPAARAGGAAGRGRRRTGS